MLKRCLKLRDITLLLCLLGYTPLLLAGESVIEPLMATISGGEFLMGGNEVDSELAKAQAAAKAKKAAQGL